MSSARSFHKRALGHIPEALRPALGPILEQIGSLTERIRDYERQLETIAKEHYPHETGLVRQVEGVGTLTALTFVLSLEDPYRFEKSRSVGAYLGLVPARDQSGDRDPQRRISISKEGDEMLRKLLVGSAPYILGPFGQDSDLRRHGEKIARRGGKNAKKRAAVAVARKLSLCSCTVCGLRERSMRSAPQHASTPRAGGGSLEGRRWSTTEHEGGEGSAIERQGDPKVADGHGFCCPR
jgi:transposase